LLARGLAAAQITLIMLGWAAAQFPYLVEPHITIADAAAPPVTLRLLLIALAVGALLLFPSLYFLYRIFKGPEVFSLGLSPRREQARRDSE
ncbi:MAG TPA: cytochrome d ubiquinol oxidase subunit II, partial [Kouleothrix sp.]|nr:cytochrome d ubiquinol oxidase subunit II [Kouleothrix sp.]